MALRPLGLRFLLLLPILSFSAANAVAADVPGFLNVVPGMTTKAEVDLSFGELLRRVNPDAELNNLGDQYQTLKNYPKAEEFYRIGLRIEPKDLLLNRNLGRVLLDRGQFEEARQQAESTLSLKPDDVWTMIDVAHAWASLGKKKQALSWIEKAVAAGFRYKNELTNDRYFENLRNQGDFKKLVAQMP